MMISEEPRLRWTVISWSNVPGQVSSFQQWYRVILKANAFSNQALRSSSQSSVSCRWGGGRQWRVALILLESAHCHYYNTHSRYHSLTINFKQNTHTQGGNVYSQHNCTRINNKSMNICWERLPFFVENKSITSAALMWQKNWKSQAQQDHVMKLWFHGAFFSLMDLMDGEGASGL